MINNTHTDNNIKRTILSPLSSKNVLKGKINYLIEYSNFEIRDYPEISVIQNFILSNNHKYEKIIAIIILELIRNNIKGAVFHLPCSISKLKLEEIKSNIEMNINNFNKMFLNKLSFEAIENISFEFSDGENILITKRGIQIFKASPTKVKGFIPSFLEEEAPKYVIFESDESIYALNWVASQTFISNSIKELKKEQILAINEINKGNNILALLRTGFGKSLIYQLYTFLSPMIHVVIFPISSLIEDQEQNLQKNNFEFMYTNDEIKKDHNAIKNDKLAKKRLIMITPERIENQIFHDNIKSLSKYIGSVIFDEAHCISEWGHDFRPSYLVAKKLVGNIEGLSKDFKTIALTATAAPQIQRDLQRLLKINDENIIMVKDKNGLLRKELNFNITKFQTSLIEKTNPEVDIHPLVQAKHFKEQFMQYFDKMINNAMKNDGLSIMYFIYANKFWGKGTSEIPNVNAEKFFLEREIPNTGIYAGNKKKYFDKNGNLIKSNSIKDYQNLDIIFATKSFGMGIDMKRCNYVSFIQPPYSLEDLYQQAGRAGRLGQNSNVDIFYSAIHLLDPNNSSSPYNYFINITDQREDLQKELTIYLLNEIYLSDQNIFKIDAIRIYGIYKEKNPSLRQSDFENFIKWSIAHLINVYKVVSYYSIKREWLHIKEISIHIKSNIHNNQLFHITYSVNKNKELDTSKTWTENIEIFYKYYFTEIHKQKKIGLNLFIKELRKIDHRKNQDHNKIIMEVINNYYKQRREEIYIEADSMYEKLSDGIDIEVIVDALMDLHKKKTMIKLHEVIAGQQINIEHTHIMSLIYFIFLNLKPIHATIEEIINYPYKNILMKRYLEDLIIFAEKKNKIIEIYDAHANKVQNKKIRSLVKLSILKGVNNERN